MKLGLTSQMKSALICLPVVGGTGIPPMVAYSFFFSVGRVQPVRISYCQPL